MNYDKVKKEIICQLDINPEMYRQVFRAKRKREEKELRALLQQLADLATKWLKPAESSERYL